MLKLTFSVISVSNFEGHGGSAFLAIPMSTNIYLLSNA